MRLAVVFCAVVLVGIAPTLYMAAGNGGPVVAGVASPHAASPTSSLGHSTLSIPNLATGLGSGSCQRTSGTSRPLISPINIPAEGTGASATYDQSSWVNNTQLSANITAPSGVAFTTGNQSQFVVIGVGDPVNASAFTAVGVAESDVYIYGYVAVPAAVLPNDTLIYNADFLGGAAQLTQGTVYNFAITHVKGPWWSYTWNGNLVTGGSATAPIAWENGTYDVGSPVAAGTMCEEGGTLGPSLVALTYASAGVSYPQLPPTNIPNSIVVDGNRVPLAANAMPQFNTTLGSMGIQGHDQDGSLANNQLTIGSVANGVPYPGAFAPLWGNYVIQILNQSAISPVSASLAYTQALPFTASALNQSGVTIPGATYSWSMSPSTLGTLSGTSGPSVTLTAGSVTANGHLWANVSYNCSHFVDMASIAVTPTGGPSITSFTVNPTPILTSESTNFSVTNATWPSPITYSYTGLPSPCASSDVTVLTCVPTVAGNYTVRVYLNDTSSHSSNATVNLRVYNAMTTPTFTFTPDPMTYNTSTRVQVTETGGIPILSYTYTGMPTNCANGTQPASFTCIPKAAGTFTVTVFVNDSAGHSVNTSAVLTINQPLAVSNVVANPSSVQVGNSTTITVSHTGGTSPFAYAYSGLPPGCATQNLSTITCAPTLAGTYLLIANMTDSSGANSSGNTLLTVTAPPVPVVATFTATPNPVNVSQQTTLNVQASGGSGALSYAYAGLPGGCNSQNLVALPCTPTVAGNFTVTVYANDTASHSGSKTLVLEVLSKGGNSGPPPTISSFTVSPSPITLGKSTYFTVVATSGTGTLSYAYAGLPAGCQSSNATQLTCTPTATGNFTVKVYVNDSAQHSVTSTATLEVNPAPSQPSTSNGTGGSDLWLIIAVVAVVAVAAIVGALLFLRKKKAAPAPLPPPMMMQ